MATKLLKWGNGVGLLVPSFAAKSCGFKPGTFVRIIVLENEIRGKRSPSGVVATQRALRYPSATALFRSAASTVWA